MNWLIGIGGDSSRTYSINYLEGLMKSSNTSSWESRRSQKPSVEQEIGEEALTTSSTRELVEFYWSNRKRFSGTYSSFPSEVK